jgi:hypothetical protein
MDQAYNLDVKKALQRFQSQFESLIRLPFIADSEMNLLFGKEVNFGLENLERLNQEKNFCRDCQNRCCRLVDCELYSETLACCPIHSFRPILCRMHFCNKFALENPSLVKDLGDIFLDSWLAAQQIVPDKAAFLDSPPLIHYGPEIISDIAARIKEIKTNKSTDNRILDTIRITIEKYRTPAEKK